LEEISDIGLWANDIGLIENVPSLSFGLRPSIYDFVLIGRCGHGGSQNASAKTGTLTLKSLEGAYGFIK